MLEKDGIIYEFLHEGDLENTIACVVDVFPSSEPMSHALGLTQEDFYPFAEIVCSQAVRDGLSHIAKDAITGKVIGFRISEDLVQDKNDGNQEIFSSLTKLLPILNLLEQLEAQYIQKREIKKGQILHWFMVGVTESYRNRNIAKNLMEENIKKAQAKKFIAAICEATGVISQHNSVKLGFKEIVSIKYKDYTYNGVKVFENITPHEKCILMEKIL